MLTKLWRRPAGRTSRPSPDRGRLLSRRLGVELLEDRALPASADVVLHWNELLVQAIGTPTAPVPMARNMALVQVAVFDAVNAIDRSYQPYATRVQAWSGASQEAAAAQAAHDTLTALYPNPTLQAVFDAALAEDLAGIPTPQARVGAAVGREVAREILALRADDGSGTAIPYVPPNADPGQWQPTPPDNTAGANFHVAGITPYAIESTSQFRPGPPPALTSQEYADDLNEVKSLGSRTSTTRTADQTVVSGLWQSALPNHRSWNRIAQAQVAARDTSLVDAARMFALLNMSLNDGLETSYGAKYHYELWRPVTAIRRAAEDGNPATEADPDWITLHQSTPPYPAYTSNASTIGGACATVLAGVFGGDVGFEINWALNGVPGGPTRWYDNFAAAANEQADARVYGGIHFRFDCEAGLDLGANVADYVLDHYLLPRDHPGHFAGGSPNAGGSIAPFLASPPAGEAPVTPLVQLDGPSPIHGGDQDPAAPPLDGPAARPGASTTEPGHGLTAGWPAPVGVYVDGDPADPLALGL